MIFREMASDYCQQLLLVCFCFAGEPQHTTQPWLALTLESPFLPLDTNMDHHAWKSLAQHGLELYVVKDNDFEFLISGRSDYSCFIPGWETKPKGFLHIGKNSTGSVTAPVFHKV